MKKNSNVQTNCDRAGKPGKARGPVQRDTKEVMAESVAKLSQGLEPRAAARSGEGRQQGMPGPNRERLTVGVDLGDRWSKFCILGLNLDFHFCNLLDNLLTSSDAFIHAVPT